MDLFDLDTRSNALKFRKDVSNRSNSQYNTKMDQSHELEDSEMTAKWTYLTSTLGHLTKMLEMEVLIGMLIGNSLLLLAVC